MPMKLLAKNLFERDFGVTTDTRTDSIVERLLSDGAIQQDQLDRALRIRERMEEPVPLTEVLVRLGLVTHQQIDKLLHEQRRSLPIEEILVSQGALSREEYDESCRIAEAHGRLLRDVLLERGSVSERQYLLALSEKHELPFVDLDVGMVDRKLLRQFSLKYLRERKVVPLMREDDRVVCAISDPLSASLLGELRTVFESDIGIAVAPTEQIEAVLEILSTLDKGDRPIPSSVTAGLSYHEIDPGQDRDNISEIVDLLIARAIRERASDIHIEPMGSKLRVRFRIDGALIRITDLPKEYGPRMTSRIKVLAEADISEKRRHQDGRIFVLCDSKEVDLRASFYVTVHGENTVLRILDRTKNLLDLEDLGFAPRMLRRYVDDVLESSSGILLVTGPTGSGKTTTLYSSVAYVNEPTKKVITCEDPVEYVIDGISQCSVNEKVGPTFGDTLRAIVRQDPDIIVLGEIRDPTSAKTAVESALTGHKVFSTFHTEDAASAVLRLVEMKVEPYMVASTLSAILAQRLVRKICPDCREEYKPGARELRLVGVAREDIAGFRFMKGSGCDNCMGTGYHGRVGIYELLLLTDTMKEAVMSHAPTHELRNLAAKDAGYVSLLEDGIAKVLEDQTTFEEILDNAPRTVTPRRIPEIQNAIGGGHSGRGGDS
jgi:type IV pilus assembly protein PilB